MVKSMVAVLILTGSLASQPVGFNLDSLLAESVGGADAVTSLHDLDNYSSQGSALINGQPGRFEQYFQSPDKSLRIIIFGGLSLIQGFNGDFAWRQDHNGNVSSVSGSEKRELRQDLYFESFSYLFPDRIAGGMEYLGLIEGEDTSYHEVAVYPGNADTVHVYFDQHLGLRRTMISEVDHVQAVTHFSDYRQVNGVLWPFRTRAVAESIPLEIELITEEIVINADFDSTMFDIPENTAADFSFPIDKESVRVEFEYINGQIRLNATINGQVTAWFILDTGASTNVLHLPSVAPLGLTSVGTLPVQGMGGFEHVDLLQTDSISIDKLTLYGQVAAALDLSGLVRSDPKAATFGGLLGHDFLALFPLMVDYVDSSVTIFNPATFSPSDSGIEIDFHLVGEVPVVTGILNGIEGDFIVDLGNSFGLILHHQFVQKHDLLESLQEVVDASDQVSGVGGTMAMKTGYASEFRMGDVLLTSLPVFLPDSSAGLTGSNDLAGNIGNLVLQNFQVLFDYSNSKLILYNNEISNRDSATGDAPPKKSIRGRM